MLYIPAVGPTLSPNALIALHGVMMMMVVIIIMMTMRMMMTMSRVRYIHRIGQFKAEFKKEFKKEF